MSTSLVNRGASLETKGSAKTIMEAEQRSSVEGYQLVPSAVTQSACVRSRSCHRHVGGRLESTVSVPSQGRFASPLQRSLATDIVMT
jgi:hypothetical protein